MINRSQDEPSQCDQPVINSPAASRVATTANNSQRVRLGSMWVSYVDSYFEAAQKLFPVTAKLAYPILYLQRHTFELLTKDILSTLLEIRGELYRLDALFGSLLGTGPVDPADFDVAHSTHSFSDIFTTLKRNLIVLGFPPLPKIFDEARGLFDSVDEGRPDRLRYATIFSKKQKTVLPSFPHEFAHTETKFAPCDEVGALLSQIMSARKRQLDNHVNNRESAVDSELDKFYDWYWQVCRTSEYEVANRLQELVEATRKGEIVWREVSSPNLNIEEHPDLKTVANSLANTYAEATFRGRTLVVVTLRDIITVRGGGTARTEDGYFLSARRPNNTLTLGVWPYDSQSDLIYEIAPRLIPIGNLVADG